MLHRLQNPRILHYGRNRLRLCLRARIRSPARLSEVFFPLPNERNGLKLSNARRLGVWCSIARFLSRSSRARGLKRANTEGTKQRSNGPTAQLPDFRISMLPAQKHTLETLLADAVKQVVQASQGASEANFVEPSIVLERPKV